eukprot:Sdes_comp19722_c0_seq2m11681
MKILSLRKGNLGEVVAGYSSLQEYVHGKYYFGAVVGRVANRIADASFQLGGKTYQLAANNGTNSLHGGCTGFDKKVWRCVEHISGVPSAQTSPKKRIKDAIFSEIAGPSSSRLVLELISPDGEEGYPGTLKVTVVYSVTERNALTIDYRATLL